MIHKTKVAKTFYSKRELPQPKSEWWPEDAGELREAIADSSVPRVLLGDGQHIRTPAIGERTFDVVRTEKCNRIISVDRESKLVRVESGIRWGDLQTELAERGMSMERYRLYPATATIGGMLSRFTSTHRELWDGDLRTGCVALSAVSGSADYRYIAAPRKASGPDLRWLFMGAEGLLGAILDATLVTWSPSDSRLFTWKLEEFEQAALIMRDIWDLGIRPSWSCWTGYKTTEDELVVAVHGPERILDVTTDTLLDRHSAPCDVEAGEAIAAKRAELEASHPDRRSLGTSMRTAHAVFSTRDIDNAIAALPDSVENVSIWNWTRHHAHAYVRYAKGKTLTELPSRVAARALDVRPVIDDEAVHWPHSAQTLKQLLDPEGVLAIGP